MPIRSALLLRNVRIWVYIVDWGWKWTDRYASNNLTHGVRYRRPRFI